MKEENEFTVNSHFEGKDTVVRKIYDELLKTLRNHGPIQESAGRSSIRLVRDNTLAGVTPRQNYVILTIKSDRLVSSHRIRRTERISPNVYLLKLKLSSPEDINEELVLWLDHAYKLSAAN